MSRLLRTLWALNLTITKPADERVIRPNKVDYALIGRNIFEKKANDCRMETIKSLKLISQEVLFFLPTDSKFTPSSTGFLFDKGA